ncbi:hypothetical protein ABC345_18080 [Shouchella sp. 1P09AA]|uniref:hypothetical protein n=1 Tax=unclassified Shouchella TaxID=2893065 RepID=UPI0039A32DC5
MATNKNFALGTLMTLSAINFVTFLSRLIIGTGSLSELFPSFDAYQNSDGFIEIIFSSTFNQALVEHTFYQLVVMALFILTPITLMRINKLSLGSISFEGEEQQKEEFKSLAISSGTIKYLAQFNSRDAFEAETDSAYDSGGIANYFNEVFTIAISEVYGEAKVDVSHQIFETRKRMMASRDVRIELKNKKEIAESGHVSEINNDDLDFRKGYKNQILVYVKSIVDEESPPLYIVISSPTKVFDQHDIHFCKGLANSARTAYDYAYSVSVLNDEV